MRLWCRTLPCVPDCCGLRASATLESPVSEAQPGGQGAARQGSASAGRAAALLEGPASAARPLTRRRRGLAGCWLSTVKRLAKVARCRSDRPYPLMQVRFRRDQGLRRRHRLTDRRLAARSVGRARLRSPAADRRRRWRRRRSSTDHCADGRRPADRHTAWPRSPAAPQRIREPGLHRAPPPIPRVSSYPRPAAANGSCSTERSPSTDT